MQPQAVIFAVLLGLGAVAAQSQSVCQTYVVQAGDTINTIAEDFGIIPATLDAALTECINGYTSGVFLQPSQRICLPPFYSACAFVQTAGGDPACKYYTVQPGDTLSGIASSLGLNQLDVEAINTDIAVLQPNMFVKLTGWGDSCPAPGDTTACRVYTASTGDSLSSIATSFSVNLPELQAVNPDLAGDAATVLQPGQQVKLVPFTGRCGAGVPVSKPSLAKCDAYMVVAGDTLFGIAAMFQTTSDQLLLANPEVAAGVLSTNTVVKLPGYNDAECVNGPNFLTGVPAPPSPPSPPPEPPMPPTVFEVTEGGEAVPGEGGPDEGEFADFAPAPAPEPEPTAFLRRRLV